MLKKWYAKTRQILRPELHKKAPLANTSVRKGHVNFTLGMAIALGILLLWILRGYFSMLLLGLIVALTYDPIYQWLKRMIGEKRQVVVALLTTVIVYLSLILPLLLILAVGAQQAIQFSGRLTRSVEQGEISVSQVRGSAESFAALMPGDWQLDRLLQEYDLEQNIKQFSIRMGQFFTSQVLTILLNSTRVLASLMVFFFVLFYWLQAKESFFRAIVRLSPLDDSEDEKFIAQFRTMVGVLIKSNVVIAIIQGTLGGIIFALLGIPSAVFWGIMMGVLSFIPIGAGLIWIPTVVILFVVGSWFKALILLLFGVVIISSVDNVIRAYMLSEGETSLPPLLTLVSVLGGIQVFGVIGVIYGPLIGMLFLSALRMYEHNWKLAYGQSVKDSALLEEKTDAKTTKKTGPLQK